MTRILLFLFLLCSQIVCEAQTRRPIDSKHPMWLVHIDVWNNADPQKIINLIPDEVKPYVVLNLSMSCAYDTKLNIHQKPQSAIRTYKSWGSVCQNNGMWFTCQPASGGHTHIQDWDLETFEYFFKRYPNFLGWNYAEQFWGFNDPGDKFSSSDVTRIALFAKLVEMSHKYGGFLTVSFCGNIWSHHLNPVGMMKRNKDLLDACKKYPEAIIWLYKYTTSSCFYNNESVCFGPFLAGLTNNYGVRYDNCGWNGALDDFFEKDKDGNIIDKAGRDRLKYPVAAGIGTVMEQTCRNGGAVWDGPELIWTEDFRNLSNSSVTEGTTTYTQRNWGRFAGFDNAWIDMFKKIIDGTMYIPTRDEVIDATKFIIYNDVTSGNNEDMYATWGDLYDNLYKQTDPFNKGNGQFMQNYWYLKKTGRYGTIPMTPGFNTGFAARIPNVIKKSQRNTQLPSSSKVSMFNNAYPEISTGDLYVSRIKNQLVTYTPYTYMNSKTTAKANIPLKYNTCESLDLTYGKLSSGIIREFDDHINFYLNNYRSDTTTNVTDIIVVNGATEKPTYSMTKRAAATASATESWDATAKKFTVSVSHNGPVDLVVNCAGSQTNRATDAIAITPLEKPKQPEQFVGELIVEGEDMNYNGVEDCVTDQYGFWGEKYRSVRGHSGMGFQVMNTTVAGRLKTTIKIPKAGKYKFQVRYSTPSKTTGRFQCKVGTSAAQYVNFTATEVNEWKKVGFTANMAEGDNTVLIVNSDKKRVFIDQIILIPEEQETEKFLVTLRDNEEGTASADYEEAAEGTKVTLSTTPKEGYQLIGWDIIHGNITIDDNNSFIMPDDNVTVQPIYKDTSSAYMLDFTDVLGGTFPPGWRDEFTGWDGKESVQEYPNSYGSGPRTFTGFTGNYGKALYWRANAIYGKQSGYSMNLEPGKYRLTFAVAAWKEAPTYTVKITSTSGTKLVESPSYTAAPNANGSTASNLSSAVERTLEFTINKAANYLINFVGGGEYLLTACRINKIPEPTDIDEVVFKDTNADSYEIYDLSGKRIPSLQRGMNIIRRNGMDVKKVFIK